MLYPKKSVPGKCLNMLMKEIEDKHKDVCERDKLTKPISNVGHEPHCWIRHDPVTFALTGQ